ncbi:DUF2778 domain-containing protein [Brenneria izadpanahii]|uniref:DUF2778 domain-containing protein n=1 Tax=Brenneria izadpanahii TaxID=2722756 RepID=UPI0031B57A63
MPDNGSIPAGKYWIVDRPAGGLGTQVRTWFYDKWNYYAKDIPVGRGEWFALYRDDGSIDDYTWINGIKRGNFRLHPGTVSKGCITLRTITDFQIIRNNLLRTSMVPVRSTSLMAYGSIEVFAHGDKCLV